MGDQIEIRDNSEASRYEAVIEGHTAQVAYRREGDTIVFVHTEVPQPLEGRGIAGKMVKKALDDAQEAGLGVVAECPYVAAYLKKHPEYAGLIRG